MNDWIIFEDEKFMAVNKPAGVLSQRDKSGDEDLSDLVRKERKKVGTTLSFLAPVHRLDRNTSGIILLAKSSTAAKQLTDWMKNGLIHRSYLALVKGDTGPSGQYNFRLRKNSDENQVYVDPRGEEAITEFIQLQKLGSASLVKAKLLTGRSHQIRVHFAHAGHALIGDKKYAKKPWSEIFHRPALHAFELEMPDRTSPLRAPIPTDFSALLLQLGGKNLS